MNDPHYIPTPEEIAAACEKVQAGWTDEEREVRSTTRLFPITLRELQKAGLRGGK